MNDWVKETIANINTRDLTQKEYEREQLRTMIKKMNQEEEAASKEAYIARKNIDERIAREKATANK